MENLATYCTELGYTMSWVDATVRPKFAKHTIDPESYTHGYSYSWPTSNPIKQTNILHRSSWYTSLITIPVASIHKLCHLHKLLTDTQSFHRYSDPINLPPLYWVGRYWSGSAIRVCVLWGSMRCSFSQEISKDHIYIQVHPDGKGSIVADTYSTLIIGMGSFVSYRFLCVVVSENEEPDQGSVGEGFSECLFYWTYVHVPC